MVFFQLVLLLGYAYAHALAGRPRRTQALLHGALLVVSLAFLPLAPDPSWKLHGGDSPVLGVLGLLFATVGLPYFLLSSTSPLAQSWHAREFPGGTPYRLFALSNFASMLALLGYPFLLEPWLSNRAQSLAWSGGYVLFVAACAWLAWRSRTLPDLSALTEHVPAAPAEAPPSARAIALWLALAAAASALLLAVTNHLTQNIPSIPLLWVVPLAIYLVTFILCFEGRRWYRRDAFQAALVVALGAMCWLLIDRDQQFRLLLHVAVFTAGLFIACMFCHGELARRRPGPRHLTLFYLVVAAGGVVGGVLVGIVAPVTLPAYLELGIALCVIAALAIFTNLGRPRWIVAFAALVSGGVLAAVAWQFRSFAEDTVYIVRDYYGVLRVKELQTDPADPETRYRSLVHGAILHGEQWLSPKYRRSATTYYKVSSGIGRTLIAMQGQPRRVAVIGLGAGSLAVYAQAGDVYRFYDINPDVERVARTWFSYLADAPGHIDVVLGDARLSMEAEAPQRYDVIAVDAFTGDSIPVHLITYEAVGEYLRHLAPGGVLAFHVSNRYLDLKPVLLAIAEKRGLEYAYLHEPDEDGGTTSDWVLLAREKPFLLKPTLVEITEPVLPHPEWRLWTDDYNNLVQVFRW